MDPTAWAGASGVHREEMQRAITVSSAGTILVQNIINRVVQALTLRYLGVWSTLDHRPGTNGAQATINRRAPGTTDGQWLNDTTEPDEDTGSYTQVTFAYRTVVSRGKVTRKMQRNAQSYADVLGTEMMEKLDDHMRVLENGSVVGNNVANTSQINGLLTLINAVGSAQVVANTTSTSGGPILLGKMDQAVDVVKGNDTDKVIFGSLNGRRKLNAALQAQQQFVNMTEIPAGFRVRSYDDIPIIPSTEIPDDLNWSGSTILAFSGGSTTALIVVNRRYVWFEDQTPTSVLPLAKTTSQADSFDIFTDVALVHANTKGGSILGGIAGS